MTDIVIIGGGIAGLSVAARLAPHADVTLLEAEDQLGYHASSRSAAVFIEKYGNAVVRALNSASVPYLKSAASNVLGPRGMLLVGAPEEKDDFRADASDFELVEISAADAIKKVPLLSRTKLGFAAFREDVFDIDTDLLLQSFRRDAQSHGLAIHTKAAVTAIDYQNRQWLITAGGDIHTADLLVNAAGAWADPIAGMAGIDPIGITPYRRSMARIPVPGGYDAREWPLLNGVNERWYAKPDAGQLLVSPADEDPMPPQDAWADDMVLAEGLARFEELMAHPVEQVTTNWAGLRSFAPDHALVIGFDPKQPAFFWLAGQGGYGFQTAAAASQLAADLILHRAPELDRDLCAQLSPTRFR